uniref:Uncharacterized protein n=1 Tax=Molossus molossus TaxID=27622 RepID=A0A7J8CRV9_MOLMO|nr:hypothetical protein HJG59_009831 [Molossus molossus]
MRSHTGSDQLGHLPQIPASVTGVAPREPERELAAPSEGHGHRSDTHLWPRTRQNNPQGQAGSRCHLSSRSRQPGTARRLLWSACVLSVRALGMNCPGSRAPRGFWRTQVNETWLGQSIPQLF